MNDDEVKGLLKKDQSTPKAPSGEWSSIYSQLKLQKRNKVNFSLPNLVGFACVLFVVSFSIPQMLEKEAVQSNAQIEEYFFNESYLESEELYTWVDLN